MKRGMLPRNKRGKRQSGGKIAVEDDHSPPVLIISIQTRCDGKKKHTGGIEETERVWVISNHDSNGIYQSGSGPKLRRGNIQLSKTVGTYSEGNLFVVYEIKRQVLGC
jgi:hypothetical protein